MLKVIADFVRKQVSEDMQVIVDLKKQYLFPTSLTYTDLWPDLVVYSNLTRTAILVELTVCFEDNFDDARARKEAKYADLVDEIEENGFVVDLVTVEVGARGFVQYDSFRRLNNLLGVSQKDLLNHLVEVSKVTIKNSFHIWTLRNCRFDPSEDTGSV